MRTKRMIFTTLLAIVVITAAMMSTALAAPASTNCPLKNALQNSVSGTAPTSNNPSSLINSLLGGNTTGTKLCPKQQALLNLLNGTNSTAPATGTTGTTKTCPAKTLLQNMLGGNTNLSSLLSGLK